MKIRSDFVTNSSSSSFILTIVINTKDDCVAFEGYASPDNGIRDYFEYDAQCTVGPKELAEAGSVDELVKLLADNVRDGGDPIFDQHHSIMSEWDDCERDPYAFIEEIREVVKSMDDIEEIHMRGTETYDNDDTYEEEYSYDCKTKEAVGFVKGTYHIDMDGPHGGEICFSKKDYKVKDSHTEE